MPTPRFYTHSVVTYNGLDSLFDLFNESKHYCYIVHDRDPTDTHIHVLCTFSRERSFKAVRNMVKGQQNTFSQEARDIADLLDYFTHDNEPDKEKYSADSIVYDDVDYWKKRAKLADEGDNKNDVLVDDLISDSMTLDFMARKYGRDFIKNYKAYLEFRHMLIAEKEFKRKGNDYDSIYI